MTSSRVLSQSMAQALEPSLQGTRQCYGSGPSRAGSRRTHRTTRRPRRPPCRQPAEEPARYPARKPARYADHMLEQRKRCSSADYWLRRWNVKLPGQPSGAMPACAGSEQPSRRQLVLQRNFLFRASTSALTCVTRNPISHLSISPCPIISPLLIKWLKQRLRRQRLRHLTPTPFIDADADASDAPPPRSTGAQQAET